MIPGTETIRNVIADLRIAASFVTLLPVGSSKPAADGAIARATWALPVAGLLVGLAGALVYKISSRLGLTPNLAALLALATTALITGALHEDGLADTADGLGGGRTRERKLEIMRDSRIGTYGVCALILSFGLRWSALAAIAIAFAVGTLVLTLALGPGKALVGLILLSLAGLILARLAIRQIGGQTGDILGAFEQTGEIVILLVAAAFQMGR